MRMQQTLQKEIQEFKRWIEVEKDDSTYKRDLIKRIELINWVLETMNNPDIFIREIIESKINEIILAINKIYSVFESDILHSELRPRLDFILSL